MRSVVTIALMVPAIGCGPASLGNAHPSAEILGREVLRAFGTRDESRLRSLAVDEGEFTRRVWPGLPAARPHRNLPVAYVWGDLKQKSDQGLRHSLRVHGGRSYRLDGVRFDGATTNHGDYRVHRDTVLIVRDGQGARHDVKVLGSMIEVDRQWKVFSYVVD